MGGNDERGYHANVFCWLCLDVDRFRSFSGPAWYRSTSTIATSIGITAMPEFANTPATLAKPSTMKSFRRACRPATNNCENSRRQKNYENNREQRR
jgi:hypothetical protein